MKLYTIGFTKKTAQDFFKLLEDADVKILIDTRINNTSQLAGFAKADQGNFDFLLKRISNIAYEHRPDFAPTRQLLKQWRDREISWDEYELQYNQLITDRGRYKDFMADYSSYENVCILCSEETPEKCHRRLLADTLKKHFTDIELVGHLGANK